MRLLDLFCGAGGAAMGYWRAGFDVLGVDIAPQPGYPFEFIQGDAFDWLAAPEFLGRSFDAIHASPPCQAYSVLQRRTGKSYPKLIHPVRSGLRATRLPYVIENVRAAPLVYTLKLCGSMFDLPVERHRLFETSFPVISPRCRHARQHELWPKGFPALRSDRTHKRSRVVGVFGTGGGEAKDIELWRSAMDIDWMTKAELAEPIPPAHTEYVAHQLIVRPRF